MIGKIAVGVKIKTARNIGTELFKNFCGIKTAHTVAGIRYNMKTFKRLFIIFSIDAFTNHLAVHLSILRHEIDFFAVVSFFDFRYVGFFGIFKYFYDVFIFKTAVFGKELESVFIRRMMACCYLDSGIATDCNCCHKHCGS